MGESGGIRVENVSKEWRSGKRRVRECVFGSRFIVAVRRNIARVRIDVVIGRIVNNLLDMAFLWWEEKNM